MCSAQGRDLMVSAVSSGSRDQPRPSAPTDHHGHLSRTNTIGVGTPQRLLLLLLLLLLPLLLSVGGCGAVRDFLIPPPSGGRPAVQRRVRAELAHMVIEDVVLPGGRHASVAVRNGRVSAVGSRVSLKKRINAGTVIVPGKGRVLTAGLVDAHVHLEGMALLAHSLDMRSIQTKAALAVQLRGHIGLVSEVGWVWGFGMSSALAVKLTADILESLAPGAPVWLSSADGHSVLLSTTLLARLPKGLSTQARDGHLSGAAARAAWYSLPAPAGERLKAFIAQRLQPLPAQGVMTIHVMGARPSLLQTLEEMELRGRLGIRCRLYLAWAAPATRHWLQQKILDMTSRKKSPSPSRPIFAQTVDALPEMRSRLVDVAGIKVWLDGTLGAHTASLSQPYADKIKVLAQKPTMNMSALRTLITQVDRAHTQLAVHVIGDAALDRLLDALTGLPRPTHALPIRIEHAQVIRPDQLIRLAKIGKTLCSIQPLHRQADASWSTQRLGQSRLSWAYRGRSLAQACPLLLGSDAPVGPIAPWAAMRALITHSRQAEQLSPQRTLAASMRDPHTGEPRRVQVGDPADFIVWSRDPTTALGQEKSPARPEVVVVGGTQMRL